MRPVVVIVTGFTKNATILERSLAPLRALKRADIVQRVLYVTWDKSDIDAFVEPVRAMAEIELVRLPEPAVSGTACYRGTAYQIANLEKALALVPEEDALIVKLRPDFIVDETFLKSKIADFDRLCAPSELAREFGVAMPPSPFAAKIWIPWADANLPLHFEDAALMGLKPDIQRFADRSALRFLGSPLLSDIRYAWLVHVARYATVFLSSYPLFENYVKKFRYQVNDVRYRAVMMPAAVQEPFFWRLVAANAWILAANFHVDCGMNGQLTFYSNSINPNADWTSLRRLKIHPPYNAVAEWRLVQHPGGMFPCVGRTHARLVDDSWQEALFTRPHLADVTPDQLRSLLCRVMEYEPPDSAEECYYQTLERHFTAWDPADFRAGALPAA